MMTKRLFSYGVVCLSVLWLSACASGPRVTTDFDQSFAFAGVRTLAFEPFSSEGDNLLLSDMQKKRLRQVMSAILQQRGYEVVDREASPDALLNWHLVTRERTAVRTYSPTVRPLYCWYCGPWMNTQVDMSDYTEGTHILDLINPAKKEGVWRAVVSVPLSLHANPERADRQLHAIATALLSEFPARTTYQPAASGSI